jgi:serine/threonine-protein kinase
MGVVYHAKDPRIDRSVALKVLRRDYAGDDYFVQRFFKEAVAIGRLSHPNIVTVYDVGQGEDTIYLAMELVEGRALSDLIKEGLLDMQGAVRIGMQVADALNYAHSRGIVHRDIKPANIILNEDRQVKITDFGIAHVEDVSATLQTHAGEILGTPVYMSPEQVLGKMPDGRSDLYSLGVVLYEMTTGRRPFTGPGMAAIFNAVTQDTPAAPAAVNPAIPKALSNLILKSLEKKPDRRFQTGQEMVEALDACLATPAPAPVPRNPKRLYLAGAAAFLLLLGVALGWRYLAPHGAGESTPLGKQAEIPPRVTTGRSVPPSNAEGRKNDMAPIPPAGAGTQSKSEPGASAAAAGPMARLNMTSDPSGAQVYINGVLKGRTPLDISLPLGKQEVRMQMEDYYNWEAQINLEKAGETPLFVKLHPVVF